MTLLENLIEGASSGNSKVDALLRQVKVLAARADSIVLDHWVEKELSGYGSGDELPQYRHAVEVEVIGHFSGPFNSGLQNAPIPKMAFPEFFRKNGLFQIAIVDPISVVEEFSNSKTPLRAPWPADVVALANGLIQSGQLELYPQMGIQQAWRQISPTVFKAVLGSVRTRILDLALSLEKTSPMAGEIGEPGVGKESLAKYVTNIFGGSNSVAVASSNFSQTIDMVPKGDEAALLKALSDAGVDESDIHELEECLKSDRADAGGQDPDKPGSRVQGWLGRISLGVAGAGGKVATSAAGGVVAALIKSYFGM
ncbi:MULTISPECIES: hypothetical protein [Actinomycetes]|uniref:AbiTii domain-containing protein n=1 Tax=Actinomycetes TaxID=1760 RepID=UPI0001DEE1A4|nr:MULTISPECIES: hypothetical protein [Actinomycetes]EFL04424.1 predicted protein [Streptomyces sp. AA4]